MNSTAEKQPAEASVASVGLGPLISAAEVRRRVGNPSDMTLWRWLKEPRMNFPQPVYIRRKRFWRESEIYEFIAKLPSEAEGAAPPPRGSSD